MTTTDPATRVALAQRDYWLSMARQAIRMAREIERAYNLPKVELAHLTKADKE